MKKEYRELRRRPLLTPLWLSALVGLVAVAAIVGLVSTLTTTTVVVVRHAEKELSTIDDPPLSTAGEQRVQALARMFGDRTAPRKLAAVYTDDTRRTQSTAASLAARLGLSITVAPDVEGLLGRIRREHRGDNVLVVAQAGTVPEIVRRLSHADNVPAMGEDEYSTIYIVTVPTLGRPSLLRLAY